MPSEPTSTELDYILVALADPTRRAIMTQLSNGPARVTDVAAPFDISLNSVSKHIRILERANLVARFRAGREHILTFNPAPLAGVKHWLETHQFLWSAQLKAFDNSLMAKDMKAKGKSKAKPKTKSKAKSKAKVRKG